MAIYRVLLDAGTYINPESLRVDGPQDVRAVKTGDFSRRGAGSALGEDRLAAVLGEQLKVFADQAPSESDADISVAVHADLGISRRDASDPDLWTFLNMTAGWPYVAWRWGRSGSVGTGRVAGGLDRSALARLWWMAELVGGADGSEKRTRLKRLLSKQDLAVSIYERPRLIRRPGLPGQLINAVGDEDRPWSEKRFRTFARSCRSYFGVRITAAFLPEQLEAAVAELADRAVES